MAIYMVICGCVTNFGIEAVDETYPLIPCLMHNSANLKAQMQRLYSLKF